MTTPRKSNIVGRPLPRVEGQRRLTGAARYVDDLDFGPDLLHAHLVTSTHPHARLTAVDVAAARSLPGVVTVLTGADLPAVLGRSLSDRHLLAAGVVRYVGEPVAVVAAATPELAEQAAALVQVHYEPLPVVTDLAAALAAGAPLVHPDLASYPCAAHVAPEPGSNIAHRCTQQRGDLDLGWSQASAIVEHTYVAAPVQHVTMEPHGGVAQMDGDGRITLWASTQAPQTQRHLIAQALGLDPERLRLVTPSVGGAFGGKTFVSIEALLVALAMRSQGRPVKLVLSRMEDFITSFRRPGLRAHIRMGARPDGVLTAVAASLVWDTGAGADAIIDLASAAMLAGTGPYRIPNVFVESLVVYTNSPIAAPMRGNGMAEMHWALEQHIDRLAAALHIDPVEMRLRNALRGGDAIFDGRTMHATGLDQCIRKAIARLRPGKAAPKGSALRRGRGVAAMWSPVFRGRTAPTTAAIQLRSDERIVIAISGVEMGQGFHTVAVQIAAGTLAVPVEWVQVEAGDTDQLAAVSAPAAGQLTWSAGNAVLRAAQSLRTQILQAASTAWGEPAGSLDIVDGQVVSHATERSAPLFDLLRAENGAGAASEPEVLLTGEGVFRPGEVESGAAQRTVSHFTTGAQAVEVEVDMETGQVEVLQLVSAFDVGHALNPDLVESQIKGGAVQGLSTTLFEHLRLDEGVPLNPGFLDYRVATALDLPQHLQAVIVEVPQDDGPFGARGVGEHALVPTAPAIANAVFDAIGVRLSELPITGESVWWALQAQKDAPTAVQA